MPQEKIAKTTYSLIGVTPAGHAFRCALGEGRSTIGRVESCTLQLPDPSVSVDQAEIVSEIPGKFILRDLGSTNGTFVNGERITEMEMTAPCKVRFGNVEGEFLSEKEVAAEPWDFFAIRRRQWMASVPAQWRLAALVITYAIVFSAGRFFPFSHSSAMAGSRNEAQAAPVMSAPVAAAIAPVAVEATVSESSVSEEIVPASNVEVVPAAAQDEEPVDAPSLLTQMAQYCEAQRILRLTSTENADYLSPLFGVSEAPETLKAWRAQRAQEAAATLWSDVSFTDVLSGQVALSAETEAAAPAAPIEPAASAPAATAATATVPDDQPKAEPPVKTEEVVASSPVGEPDSSFSLQVPVPFETQAYGFGLELAPIGGASKAMPGDGLQSPKHSLTVLILGDSMSLCGFGKRLDDKLRTEPQVGKVFTYMASGTNPLSWLKDKPFSTVKTFSGFWSIEGETGQKPKVCEDTYGMRRGYRPKAHTVPKLEDLLAAVRPDILIVQNGTNLFSIFRDGKTVREDREGPELRHYLSPFLNKAISAASPLKKIYWIGSPVSGRVSTEIQDFVFQQVQACGGDMVSAIDSRQLITYPYKHTQPDREHFEGADMDHWADKVFALIDQDLSTQPIAALPPLHEKKDDERLAQENRATDGELMVDAKLVFKSQPLTVKELLPYQESLVGYVYDVQQVIKGTYTDKQVLVMHPAHIQLRNQPLDSYRIGKSYKLSLRELEGTAWNTVKSRDDSGKIDLIPYIRAEDEMKFPGQPAKSVANTP